MGRVWERRKRGRRQREERKINWRSGVNGGGFPMWTIAIALRGSFPQLVTQRSPRAYVEEGARNGRCSKYLGT